MHKIRSATCERYPIRHVKAVLRALRQELRERHQLSAIEAGQHVDEPDVWLTKPDYCEEFYDAITGAQSDPSFVAKARNAEMTFLFDQLKAYMYDTLDNWLKTTGKRAIPVKSVDVNKGDRQRPEVRSRLTVAETKHRTTLTEAGNAQAFSATPPYEALRLHVYFVMSPRSHEEMSHVLMFIDITRAHPHCSMRRQVWVHLPQEDPRSTEEGVCGLLVRSICGLRDAGMHFGELTRQVMDKLGFTCGLWSPCVYIHHEQNMQAYGYGDNFVIKGARRDPHDFCEQLKGHMWARNEGVLGPDPGQGDKREVVCLNRVFRWCLPTGDRQDAIEIEADARHADILTHQPQRCQVGGLTWRQEHDQ